MTTPTIDEITRAIYETFSDGDMVVACGDQTFMDVRREAHPLVTVYDPSADTGTFRIGGTEVVSIPIQCRGFLIMERGSYKRLMLALGRETLREGSLEQFQEMFRNLQV